ncbi:MAG: arylesterase [Pedobacter sp.]|jgi:acyl-CoA thioesterase-1|nr:arylesterase [Pedobacter sp.]
MMTKLRSHNYIYIILLVFLACSNGKAPNKTDQSVKIEKKVTPEKPKTLLFFGDSLTAGYGLNDPDEAFPGLLQEKIDSLNLPYKVVTAGLSGETSAGGRARVPWILKQNIDVFVLELGANDGLRGISPAETSKNLQDIIDQVKAKYPNCKIVLTGMLMPPTMGAKYAADFKAVFPTLAKENKLAFVPFLLEGVGGVSRLNQGDGIHPTAAGHRILADNVWSVLKDVL